MIYSILVESLKRLYLNQLVNQDKIKQMYESKKITKEEYEYILGKG